MTVDEIAAVDANGRNYIYLAVMNESTIDVIERLAHAGVAKSNVNQSLGQNVISEAHSSGMHDVVKFLLRDYIAHFEPDSNTLHFIGFTGRVDYFFLIRENWEESQIHFS